MASVKNGRKDYEVCEKKSVRNRLDIWDVAACCTQWWVTNLWHQFQTGAKKNRKRTSPSVLYLYDDAIDYSLLNPLDGFTALVFQI